MRSRLLELLPGRNLGWPLHGGGHTQTAFKKGEFPTAIGLVHIRDADVTGCAVVARKNDQSILINAVVLQCLKHAAHTSIDRPNHGAINSPTVVLNLGQSVVVFFAGLKGRVNTPVRQVHEERSVFVFANGVNSFIGKVVCEVSFGLKPFTPVEAHAKTHVGPQKSVDGIKVLFGIDSTRIVDRQIQTTFHEQAFVKALVVGAHFWRTA